MTTPLSPEEEARKETKTSLSRIQGFDTDGLHRAELGKSYSFEAAIKPAKRLIDLFKRLSVEALDDFGTAQLNQIKTQADACYSILNSVLTFDETQPDAHGKKNTLIGQIKKAYEAPFGILFPMIGYSLYKSADFQRLDVEAHAVLQSIKDETDAIKEGLEKQQTDAEVALQEIRNTAAEKGVTLQAIYFKEEADKNETDAETWRGTTVAIAIGLGVYAFASLFIHIIPAIAPENTYETIQIAVSKILIFAVISYMLYLSARNFLSHKHNAVVNRHRQNALMTYQTLTEAGGEKARGSDAVLMHAAACIYAPQPTGYAAGDGGGQSAKSVIELFSKPLSSDE